MKRLAIFSFVILFSGSLLADNTPAAKEKAGEAPAATVILEGTVTDFLSGESLAGVEIKVDGSQQVIYTDLDGHFSLEVKPGSYNLVASFISYNKSLVENLEVTGEKNKIEIKMQESE
ncbi:MAG: hypothetical protein Kow00127_22860 [Bacteroidales bacterium]